jgi:hypothetical protein
VIIFKKSRNEIACLSDKRSCWFVLVITWAADLYLIYKLQPKARVCISDLRSDVNVLTYLKNRIYKHWIYKHWLNIHFFWIFLMNYYKMSILNMIIKEYERFHKNEPQAICKDCRLRDDISNILYKLEPKVNGLWNALMRTFVFFNNLK